MNECMKGSGMTNFLIRWQPNLNCRWHHSSKMISFLDHQEKRREVQSSLWGVIRIEPIWFFSFFVTRSSSVPSPCPPWGHMCNLGAGAATVVEAGTGVWPPAHVPYLCPLDLVVPDTSSAPSILPWIDAGPLNLGSGGLGNPDPDGQLWPHGHLMFSGLTLHLNEGSVPYVGAICEWPGGLCSRQNEPCYK